MREAVIVEGVRTAVGRAKKGTTRSVRADDMMAEVIRELLRRVDGALAPQDIDDVELGCAMPEGSQGLNIARQVVFRAGLPDSIPAQTINRFCSSGLQSIATAAYRIMAGDADTIIAGGLETMSLVPMTGFRISPNPTLARENPEVYIGMGLTAEKVAEEYGISREDQDLFAYESHMKAARAWDEGRFNEQIVPIEFEEVWVEDGEHRRRRVCFDRDEHLRPDTTPEALAKLRPVFKPGGTVTAGNSSPLSDGAAGVIIMAREKAEALGLKPRLKFRNFAVAGVRPEVMGIGPVEAVPKALRLAGLSLDDIDLIELNEAFAAQALAVVRQLEIDPARLNVDGGAIALGHPLGCTGSKLTVQLMHQMERTGAQFGMVTMCIGGGMGAAGIFERVS
ncbi:MAG TPA: acetyl-CoA C-acyltransferase [Aggregatilineales bacterium]|nr:acetyl-CoA C-acyltransferase [Aggregatilineales bacterium]